MLTVHFQVKSQIYHTTLESRSFRNHLICQVLPYSPLSYNAHFCTPNNKVLDIFVGATLAEMCLL